MCGGQRQRFGSDHTWSPGWSHGAQDGPMVQNLLATVLMRTRLPQRPPSAAPVLFSKGLQFRISSRMVLIPLPTGCTMGAGCGEWAQLVLSKGKQRPSTWHTLTLFLQAWLVQSQLDAVWRCSGDGLGQCVGHRAVHSQTWLVWYVTIRFLSFWYKLPSVGKREPQLRYPSNWPVAMSVGHFYDY